MGAVYQVEDLELNSEIVAFKILHQQSEVDPEVFQRFRNEVLIARSLSHPNIVRSHDLGRTQDGTYYITMEYVEGRTLKEVLKGLDLHDKEIRQKLYKLFLDVLEGVHYAHSKGVIHRDLKPANILIAKSGEAKIADFGTARSIELSEGLTKTGFSVGTPEYMSPEQIRGEVLDQACDIYSLGVLLYELLTGVKPFTADSPIGVAYKQLNEPLPTLEEKGFLGLSDVQNVIDKATRKDKSERYVSVKEFRNDFKNVIGGGDDSGSFVMPSAKFADEAWTLGGGQEGGSSGLSRFKKNGDDKSLLVFFIIVGLVLGLGYFYYKSSEVPEMPLVLDPVLEVEDNNPKIEIVEVLKPSPVKPVLPEVKESIKPFVSKEISLTPVASPSIIEKSPSPLPSPVEVLKQSYIFDKLEIYSPDRKDSAFSSVFRKSEVLNIKVLLKQKEVSIPFSASDIQNRTDLVITDPTTSVGIDRLKPSIELVEGGIVVVKYEVDVNQVATYPNFIKIDFKVDGQLEKGTFIKFAEFVVKNPASMSPVSIPSQVTEVLDPEVGSTPSPSNEQVGEQPQEALGEQIALGGTIDILDPQNGIKEPHGFQMMLVKQGDAVSGTGKITGLGEYKVVGKYYERGIELELLGEKENLKLVGGKRDTGFKGTFISASGGASRGSWMVK
jgi:serine/threonine protein kinase